ncbi:DNA primase, partial [Streptomonospora algeriensis]
PAPQAPPGAADSAPYDLRDPSLQRERQALKIAVQYPGLASEFDELGAESFTVPQHRAVYELISAQGGARSAGDANQWAAGLCDAAPDEDQRTFVTRLAVEPIEVYGELDEHYAREILGTIKIHSINRRVANLKSRLGRLDPSADPDEYQRVFAELMSVEQQRRVMRER